MARRQEAVKTLVANLALVALRFPAGRRLMVPAAKQRTTRYDRPGLPQKALLTAIGALSDAGHIIRRVGSRGHLVTTIEPTRSFRKALMQATREEGEESISRLPGAESILLKAYLPQRGRQKPHKVLISYADCREADALRTDVAEINRTINGHDVRLYGLRKVPTALRRSFLIEDPKADHEFTGHGRLWGGWWQGLPKDERAGITINSERVVEIDYQGAFLRIAYALAGEEQPQGDPYAIPGLEAYRDGVKKVVASMFFRTAPLRRLSPELAAELPQGIMAREVRERIAARHPAIAHLFGSNVGGALTFCESSILVAVLLRLAREGICGLGIHDCVVVAESHVESARRAMLEESARVIGVALPVAVRFAGETQNNVPLKA